MQPRHRPAPKGAPRSVELDIGGQAQFSAQGKRAPPSPHRTASRTSPQCLTNPRWPLSGQTTSVDLGMVLAWKSTCSCLTRGSWIPADGHGDRDVRQPKAPGPEHVDEFPLDRIKSLPEPLSYGRVEDGGARGVFEEPPIAFGGLQLAVDELRMLLELLNPVCEEVCARGPRRQRGLLSQSNTSRSSGSHPSSAPGRSAQLNSARCRLLTRATPLRRPGINEAQAAA